MRTRLRLLFIAGAAATVMYVAFGAGNTQAAPAPSAYHIAGASTAVGWSLSINVEDGAGALLASGANPSCAAVPLGADNNVLRDRFVSCVLLGLHGAGVTCISAEPRAGDGNFRILYTVGPGCPAGAAGGTTTLGVGPMGGPIACVIPPGPCAFNPTISLIPDPGPVSVGGTVELVADGTDASA